MSQTKTSVTTAPQSRVIEGHLSAAGLRFALVATRFNDFIVDRLVGGAQDAIRRHGGNEELVTLVRVPGAFELPLVVRKLIKTGSYDAVVALGAVIRGSTPHFDYVAGEAAKGLAAAANESGVPVAFGVLTTDTIEQAIERAGTKAGNKGYDAAMTAIEMINLLRNIE